MTSNWVFFSKIYFTGRLVKQYNSVYCIHTFSRSKDVNIKMIKKVNCQSEILLKYHTMSQKIVFSIFRIFNEHEMYTLLTIINKQNYLIFIILNIFCIFIQLSKLDIEYFINSSPSLYLSLTNS